MAEEEAGFASTNQLAELDDGKELFLFKFPQGFDTAAFSRLSLTLPTDAAATRFELQGTQFVMTETRGESSGSLLNLFHNSDSKRLCLGKPFVKTFVIQKAGENVGKAMAIPAQHPKKQRTDLTSPNRPVGFSSGKSGSQNTDSKAQPSGKRKLEDSATKSPRKKARLEA